MQVNFRRAKWSEDSEGLWLSVLIPFNMAGKIKQFIQDMPDKLHTLTIKRFRNKRSLDANSYCWKLCTEISRVTGIPKDEVYRQNIQQGNEYHPLPIPEDAVEAFARHWGDKGTGWFIEVVDDSKLEGYKRVHAYYGSSIYDTKEMADLIDRLAQDAKAVGVEVLTRRELELLKEDWNDKTNKSKGGLTEGEESGLGA